MTPLKRTRRKNRLKQLIAEPGGITIAEALDNAEVSLESIRYEVVAAIDEKLKAMQVLAKAKPGSASLDQLYSLSDDIFGLAGTFGFQQLSEAARSLCDLVERLSTEARYNSDAVNVHVEGLALLRAQNRPADLPLTSDVIEGLRAVVKRA